MITHLSGGVRGELRRRAALQPYQTADDSDNICYCLDAKGFNLTEDSRGSQRLIVSKAGAFISAIFNALAEWRWLFHPAVCFKEFYYQYAPTDFAIITHLLTAWFR